MATLDVDRSSENRRDIELSDIRNKKNVALGIRSGLLQISMRNRLRVEPRSIDNQALWHTIQGESSGFYISAIDEDDCQPHDDEWISSCAVCGNQY